MAIVIGILFFVIFFTCIYISLPLAIIFSIIAFVRYLKLKSYKLFRNLAIIFYLPAIIIGILYMFAL